MSFDVFPVGDHRGRAPEDSLFATEEAAREDLLHVDEKRDGEHEGAELVKEEDGAEAADCAGQAARPDALAEAQRQAGSGEAKKRGEQHRVQVALLAREAD